VISRVDLRRILREIPLFATLTEGMCEFILEGDELVVRAGEPVTVEGDPAEHFYVLLEGEVQITKRVGDRDALITAYWPGTFFGELPILLGTSYLATGRAITDCRVLRLGRDGFWMMITNCPWIARDLLETMAQRVYVLESISQQQARLASIGTMAAGLAHELNNPAAAGRRAAVQLGETFHRLQDQVKRLSGRSMTPAQRDALTHAQRLASEWGTRPAALDPLARSDRESELAAWLQGCGVADAWRLAPVFADAGIDRAWLNALAAELPAEVLVDTLEWIESTLSAAGLLGELTESTGRITKLVDAVKGYTALDRSEVQEIDVHQGLEDTLTVLAPRLGGVALTRDFTHRLPRIEAHGGLLNQVWTHLLENAVDAVEGRGAVRIRTALEPDWVLVEIIDDGPGIPYEVRGRIFDLFFTTKEVGRGAGLGLAICHRIIVNRHGGDIRIHSRPGDTRVQVRLPIRPSV
jgi:signal transduction histidine kinase